MSERYIWNTSYIALRVWNQMKPRCLAVMSANFYCVEKPEKFFQDFNGIWTRDLAIPVRCSNQLSYEATVVGSWSLLSSQLPVISNYEWKIYMKYIIYCTAGMKSNETTLSRSDERKFLLRREAWKFFQDFNGIWTRDLAIPVRCSNQLSYEATDVGSWSLLSSQLPVISNYEWKIYMKYIIYCTAGMKSNETTLSRSDERKFLLRREAWKIFSGLQRDLNPRPRDTGAML